MGRNPDSLADVGGAPAPTLRGEGLLAAWLQVPAVHEDELNDWYDTEHLAQVSSAQGFLSARRYRTVSDGENWYLALYDLTSPGVYADEPVQRILANPTPWSRRLAKLYGPNRAVTVYRKILQIGRDPPEPAPFIFVARMDVDPHVEAPFNDWYDHEHAPRLAEAPGCLRVRRFVAVHGTPRFAAIYDLTAIEVLKSDAWIDAREYGRTQRMREHMSNVTTRACRRVFVLR